jgi:indolepyruvate ferredoxin oxidoreductase, beta subunit
VIKQSYTVAVTGLGGQGILLISRIIADAALAEGYYVCRTECRGLSQRGGSVCSVIRFGMQQITPAISDASVDLILSLDLLEAVRASQYKRPNGTIISNVDVVPPAHVLSSWRVNANLRQEAVRFNESIVRHSQRLKIKTVPLKRLSASARCPKAQNTVLLGTSTHVLPLSIENVRIALLARLKPADREMNSVAFQSGHDFGKSNHDAADFKPSGRLEVVTA